MGLCVPKDATLRTGRYQRIQNESVSRAFGTRAKLSVGECPCSPQAKLDVALGVELAGLLEMADRLGSSFGIVASLNKDWVKPSTSKRKRAKESGATGAAMI